MLTFCGAVSVARTCSRQERSCSSTDRRRNSSVSPSSQSSPGWMTLLPHTGPEGVALTVGIGVAVRAPRRAYSCSSQRRSAPAWCRDRRARPGGRARRNRSGGRRHDGCRRARPPGRGRRDRGGRGRGATAGRRDGRARDDRGGSRRRPGVAVRAGVTVRVDVAEALGSGVPVAVTTPSERPSESARRCAWRARCRARHG